MRFFKTKTILLCLIFFAAVPSHGKITLPPVIGNNMVLQQQTSAALFGKAKPGSRVKIHTSWNGKTVSTSADPQSGKWLAYVQTPAAGGPYDITISDGEKLSLHDVLIGEVWLASGQSNMEMPMKGYVSLPVKDGVRNMLSAKPSRPLRICNIQRNFASAPAGSCGGKWKKNEPGTVAWTSATAYFFADVLQETLDIPVGIIVSSWGGSKIETWLKREVFENNYPDVNLKHLDNKTTVEHPTLEPAMLYNGQIAPLIPYTIKGIIWYQGEQNIREPDRYVNYLQSYAAMMRSDFRSPDASLYVVQIAPYFYEDAPENAVGYFCEAQQKALRQIPHSGYVTTTDIGVYGNIHPPYKREVGERLAWLALYNDYGFKIIEALAPTYKSVEFKEGEAYITMNVSENGLSPVNSQISGFEIAGKDRRFVPAEARLLDGKKNVVRVWSDDIPEPVAVRYCWRNWSVGGLFNNSGIPAGPFRTDDWPQE